MNGMAEPICIDASVLVALMATEVSTARLTALWQLWLQEERPLVAPRLLPFEVLGALQRKVRLGELKENLAHLALSLTESTLARIRQPEIVGGLPYVWTLAEVHRLRVWDACYVAIARQEGAELWTLDVELAHRAGGKRP